MSDPFALDPLRAQVASDKAIYKSEKERFNRLLASDAAEITEADRRAIINWSRTSITDYSRQLEKMEEIEEPTKEEKQVMHLLNELIMLGDQIAEFTSNFVKEFEIKFGKNKIEPEVLDLPEGSYHRADGKVFQKKSAIRPSGVQAAQSETQLPIITITPPPATVPLPAHGSADDERSTPQESSTILEAPAQHAGDGRSASDGQDIDEEEEEEDEGDAGGESLLVNPEDPEGIYAVLGLSPSATWPEIRKAHHDMIKQLHPDKNRDVEDAAARFADYKALYNETLGDEEKRAAYDKIQTADELERLTNRVKCLTTQ